MLTSPMRLAFATTIERRRNRASPCRLAGVVPLDAVRLVLARLELPNRQEPVIDRVLVRAVKAGAPARQPLDEALTGGLVTTAAFPVHQLP